MSNRMSNRMRMAQLVSHTDSRMSPTSSTEHPSIGRRDWVPEGVPACSGTGGALGLDGRWPIRSGVRERGWRSEACIGRDSASPGFSGWSRRERTASLPSAGGRSQTPSRVRSWSASPDPLRRSRTSARRSRPGCVWSPQSPVRGPWPATPSSSSLRTPIGTWAGCTGCTSILRSSARRCASSRTTYCSPRPCAESLFVSPLTTTS